MLNTFTLEKALAEVKAHIQQDKIYFKELVNEVPVVSTRFVFVFLAETYNCGIQEIKYFKNIGIEFTTPWADAGC